ncbi:hypothetical protein PSHI8_21440 [Polynucleobacter sp. SHI8]|nr:hypothetical protein PSHI2_21420 [Polynucleobacter sp. SHI2]BDW14508.1 hypothetical protein PSHI8_21440 [Polynucleobacter sp. SHI8]
MKKIEIIPSNNKTLFLRNLEVILVSHQIINKSMMKDFRNGTCYEILDLLTEFLLDDDNKNNYCQKNHYINDSLFSRYRKNYNF